MAISTDRSVLHPVGGGGAVNAGFVARFDIAMAGAASAGDSFPERLGGGLLNLVAAPVAGRALGSRPVSFLQLLAVDTVHLLPRLYFMTGYAGRLGHFRGMGISRHLVVAGIAG